MAQTLFTVLKTEHKEIKRLAREAEKDPQRFTSFTEELQKHVHAEEEVFYTPMKGEKSVHELILEGFAEHHVVDTIIREMKREKAGSDEWNAMFKVMTENLEHHIEEEETQLFPKAEQVTGRTRAMEMAEEYETAEKELVGTA